LDLCNASFGTVNHADHIIAKLSGILKQLVLSPKVEQVLHVKKAAINASGVKELP